MSAKFFRAVLVVAFLVNVGGSGIYFALPNLLPPELLHQKAEILHSEHATAPMGYFVSGCLFILAWPVSLIGLYFFKRYARLLYVAALILGTELEASMGPEIEPRIIALTIGLGNFIGGFILALIFWSPIAERFSRDGKMNRKDQTL